MVKMKHKRNRGGPGPIDLTDADISYPLNRLFDPFNLDHVPENKRMDLFEHRDMPHVKHYKAAVKIFGGPLSRKRVIIAPPMETPLKHRLGNYLGRKSPPSAAPVLNTALIPQIPPEKPPPEELVIAKQAQEREDKYKAWFRERQIFRNDLENMGLNMDWLTKKQDKTVLEKRVLRQMREDAGKLKDDDVETSEPASRSDSATTTSSDLPHLKIPAPLGLKILEQYLKENKMRLLDLFTQVDRNKDWRLSRDEFLKVCEQRRIPISQGLLEDMLITLDMNMDEELDYKEMAQGLEMVRRERRENKRKELSRETTGIKSKSGTSADSQHKASGQPDRRSSGQPDRRSSGQPDRRSSRRSSGQQENQSVSGQLEQQPLLGKPEGGSVKSHRMDSPSEKHGPPSLHTTISSSTKSSGISGKPPVSRKSPTGGKSPQADRSSGSAKSSARTKSPQQAEAAGKLPRKSEVMDTMEGENTRGKSPQHLEPPEKDLRPEQMVLNSEEQMVDLRKRDREGLKGYNSKLTTAPVVIKTGSKAIDEHCMRSTMNGEVGEMVDNFRQKRLQEYHAVSDLCERNDVALSRMLLEKVLLYPPDLPYGELKKIRHPDSAPLVSQHFADPPKKTRALIEEKHKDKVRRSRSGKLLIDTRHQYPMHTRVAADGWKHNLSTGRAVIRRKVDCWMTFEEYERLTKHLAIRYQHLHGSKNHNAFWPGHLLDKVRLCMPPYDQPGARDKEGALYRRVHRTPAVNYGYEPTDAWPMNDNGYTQIGIHDHFRHKTIV